MRVHQRHSPILDIQYILHAHASRDVEYILHSHACRVANLELDRHVCESRDGKRVCMRRQREGKSRVRVTEKSRVCVKEKARAKRRQEPSMRVTEKARAECVSIKGMLPSSKSERVWPTWLWERLGSQRCRRCLPATHDSGAWAALLALFPLASPLSCFSRHLLPDQLPRAHEKAAVTRVWRYE